MKSVILAAGKGTRLRPLTYAIPKPVLPVAGRPVIDYVVENVLTCSEVDEIVIASSHEGYDAFERYMTYRKYSRDVKIEIVETKGWETGGDLRICIEEANIDDAFIACNGDTITSIDIDQMLEFHRILKEKKGTTAICALFEVPEESISRFGIAELDEIHIIERDKCYSTLIKNFVEKPTGRISSRLANAGYYIIDKEVLERKDIYLPASVSRLEKTMLEKLAEEKKLASYVFYPPLWLDIGTFESYVEANKMIINGKGIIPPPLDYHSERKW